MAALVDWPELEHVLLPGEALESWVGGALGERGAAELFEADPLLSALCDGDDGLCADGPVAPYATEAGGGDLGSCYALRRWRCLDARHGPGPCPRCTPPPADADAERFALRGDAKSGREGEKRLRYMLARCSEWSDPVAREAVALLAEAEGIPELSDALRRRSLASLRKRSFLALCRFWGYRSDVWAPLDTRDVPARRRAAALLAGPVAQPQPHDAAGDAVHRDLSPTLTSFFNFAGMPLLCAASVFDPFSPIATVNMQTMNSMIAATRGLEAMARRDGALLREKHALLLGSGEGDVPAWRLGPRAPALAEAVVHNLLLLANAHSGSLADVQDSRIGFEAVMQRPMNALETAHTADNVGANEMLHRALSMTQAALAHQRLGKGKDYLSAAAAVLATLEAICGAVHRGTAARMAMLSGRIALQPWTSTLIQHGARAGILQLTPEAEPPQVS